jgi:histidine triad (HIT) family protein
MSAEEDCIFCKIVAGEIPSFTLCEDERTLAFMDINPANDGHALVIPKRHARDLHEIADADAAAVIATARRVAGAVDRTVKPAGLNLVQCNGEAAGQSVFHFHMHVLPRATGDELKMNWGLTPGDMQAIGALAERIRENLEH